MYGQTLSYAVQGIDAKKVIIESDIRGGLYHFSMVHYP